ncbi:hypothetical protein LJR290_007326 [Variovorax sp. LjRoot290]|uniref:hypothetical protein n=1 Tax=unclassified Variovorax TaxID=663243 RepID=UPI003ECEC608
MWKLAGPIVIAGYTLSPAEAGLRGFTQEFSRLSNGVAPLELLAYWAIEIYPSKADRDPTEVAHEEFENAARWFGNSRPSASP